MTPDPYRTLGVAKAASAADIKSAYRRLAREHHPDRKPGDKRAENRFKDISNAYALLSDAAKRRRFDAGEIDANGNPRRGFASGHAGPKGYDAYKRSGSGGGGGGFGFGGGKKSRFNQFFRDKAGGKSGASIKAKGADVTYTLKVTLSEAAKGASKTVRMTSGRTLNVRIPPGTSDGQILRLKNQGMDGLGGGAAGDALVEILLNADGPFKAEGLDVHCEECVTLDEALLGAHIEVQTLHGPVRVHVPENSNTGTRLRLKGRGVHSTKSGEKGDHYVTLKVVLPKGPNTELKKFVKKWAAKNPYSVRAETLKSDAAE